VEEELIRKSDAIKAINEVCDKGQYRYDMISAIKTLPAIENKQDDELFDLVRENYTRVNKEYLNEQIQNALSTIEFKYEEWLKKIRRISLSRDYDINRIDPVGIIQSIKDKQLEVWWIDNKYKKCYCVFLSDIIHCEDPPIHEYGDTILLCEIPYEVKI
jgi:hypothetical protein